jgi:hypothetical protein
MVALPLSPFFSQNAPLQNSFLSKQGKPLLLFFIPMSLPFILLNLTGKIIQLL